MPHLSRCLLPATLSLALLAGCQGAPPLHALKQPLFAMGQASSSDSVALTPAGRHLGVLTVSFMRALSAIAARRVMATVTDIEKVVVTVTPAGGGPVSETVLKAAIDAGQTTVTFQGLAPGAATVVISAFDADGQNIGTVTQSASVAAGQTTTVDMVLQLDPTFTSGTGGGGTGPTTGGLTANVTIQDGPVVTAQAGEVIFTKELDFEIFKVAVDGQGNAWACGIDMSKSPWQGRLVSLKPDGTVAKSLTFGTGLYTMASNKQDRLWVFDGPSTFYELDTDGNELNRYQIYGSSYPGRGNASGTFLFWDYADWDAALVVPTTGQRYSLDFYQRLGALTLGRNQDIWRAETAHTYLSRKGTYVNQTGSFLIHQDAAGTELSATHIDGYNYDMATVDHIGQVWVVATPDGGSAPARLYKFDAQGLQLGVTELSNGTFFHDLDVAPDGTVWVMSEAGMTRVSPTGVELSMTPLAGGKSLISAGSAGTWLIQGWPTKRVSLLAP